MGHNNHDNQPKPGGFPMPWKRPQRARMTPDPAPDKPYIDRTPDSAPRLDQVAPSVEPPKRRLRDGDIDTDPLKGLDGKYEIIGTSKMRDEPIYRCTTTIGLRQCDFLNTSPTRMAGHARSSVHWSNNGVLNNPTPEPETTSPGVDPRDLTFAERTYDLIRQTQKELLAVIEVLDKNPNMNETDSRWNLNRMSELKDKLSALKLIVDSTPPVIVTPNTRPHPRP